MAAQKNTDQIKKALSILELLGKARGNPLVLLIVAIGGGLISQETLQNIGQNIQWWWVALGVAGFGLVDFGAACLKKIDNATADIAEIKTLLKVGHEKHQQHDREIAELKEWKAQQALRTVGKPTSKGNVRAIAERS